MNARSTNVRSLRIAAVMVCTLTLLGARCPGTNTSPRTIPITPMCTILCAVRADISAENGQVFVSERTDPNANSNFAAFRPMSPPLGNPAIRFALAATGVLDTYGISEAWLRVPVAPEVHRAQATPVQNSTSTGSVGSTWNITVQNASGSWSSVNASGSWLPVGTGTAYPRVFGLDTPEQGALTVPQLMPVGVAYPQMFACAGGSTENGGSRTTWLIESIAPRPAQGRSGDIIFIQDILNGDRYFVPNRPIPSAPLAPPSFGPPTPPTPRMSGPGRSDREWLGAVRDVSGR